MVIYMCMCKYIYPPPKNQKPCCLDLCNWRQKCRWYSSFSIKSDWADLQIHDTFKEGDCKRGHLVTLIARRRLQKGYSRDGEEVALNLPCQIHPVPPDETWSVCCLAVPAPKPGRWQEIHHSWFFQHDLGMRCPAVLAVMGEQKKSLKGFTGISAR